jgi:acyl carrier protein
MKNMKQEIRNFVVENYCFNQEGTTLVDEDSFMEIGLIDSTGILELISFVEEKYSIKLDADELIPENLDSISRLTVFLSKKLSQKRQPCGLAS